MELAGFNDRKSLDSRINRIFLPKRSGLHETRSLHNGRHTQVAMDEVAWKMEKIVKEGKAQNWSQARYRSELRHMLVEERVGLRAGTTSLYAKPRPGVK